MPLTTSIFYGQSIGPVASEFPLGYSTGLSIKHICLMGQFPMAKESFANQPERRAVLSIPVERISLYSSNDRPLKLVSLGRGYWSQGADGKRREGRED